MPGAERDAVPAPDPAAVAAVVVDVQIRGDAGTEEGVVEVYRLPRVEPVVAGAGKESGRRILRRGDVHRRPARVDQADEVGAAALLLHRIRGGRIAAVEADVREGGERASRGEPDDAD